MTQDTAPARRGQCQRDRRPRRDGDRQCDRQRHRRAGSDVGACRQCAAHRRRASGTGTAGTVGNALVGLYGALTLNFDGSYTYQLDNNNAVVQAAGSTDHLHDFFTYTVRDTAGLFDLAQIDIDITGANDPPTANPDTPTAIEAGGVNNTALGTTRPATSPIPPTTPIRTPIP